MRVMSEGAHFHCSAHALHNSKESAQGSQVAGDTVSLVKAKCSPMYTFTDSKGYVLGHD